MNTPTPLTRQHWDMVDCLFDEIFLGKHEDTLHGPEMLEELFRYFASHDPRFHRAGLTWNPKGCVEYTDEHGQLYQAEGAIAAFLGLELKVGKEASYYSLRTIYKPFKDLIEARTWLRWHVQKMHGYDNKQRDLWTGYPRDFPNICNGINELTE